MDGKPSLLYQLGSLCSSLTGLWGCRAGTGSSQCPTPSVLESPEPPAPLCPGPARRLEGCCCRTAKGAWAPHSMAESP